jgi:hypothetical protein
MDREELRRLIMETADDNGRVTPEGVVAAAADPENPLHNDPGFLWDDDAEAARQHRIAYAARLMRRVYVVVRRNEKRTARVPYFVRDPAAAPDERGSVTLESVPPASGSAIIVARDEARRVVAILSRTHEVLRTLQLNSAANHVSALLCGARELSARLDDIHREEVA